VNVLLVPAHPGFPGQIPQSRKTVVVGVYFTQPIATKETAVQIYITYMNQYPTYLKQTYKNVGNKDMICMIISLITINISIFQRVIFICLCLCTVTLL